MGLLTIGTPLSWEEAKKYINHVKQHGLEQFIHMYHKMKARHNDTLKWGDEVEYMLTWWDSERKICALSLRGESIVDLLNQHKQATPENGIANWNPEYAKYMIEGTPSVPYGHSARELLSVEDNMKKRRALVAKFLLPNELLMSLTSFPVLGTMDKSTPFMHNDNPLEELSVKVTNAQFIPDQIIHSHPRFSTLTRNIRLRREKKVEILVPIYKDSHTVMNMVDPAFMDPLCTMKDTPVSNKVYMDAMAFGMGCCCLQITFQACSIHEARQLYDQLATVAPIAMALTAASPIHRGYLCDIDCRWSILRTPSPRRCRSR